MRIQHNIASLNAANRYSGNTGEIKKNLEKLSSGYRINRSADDAAGLSISEKMRAQIVGLKTAQKNVKDGIGLIQTAEGALTEVHSMLNRMYGLADQAANGVYSFSERNFLNQEVQALKSEINRIGKCANFNGIELFTGNLEGTQFVIGENSNSVMTLSFDGLLSGARISTESLNLSGALLTVRRSREVEDGTYPDGRPLIRVEVYTTTVRVGVVNVSTASQALDSMDAIYSAINSVSLLRGRLGAYQNRLMHTAANLSVTHENLTNAESVVRDTDVAEEMMAYTKNNILVQSAQAMMAQANQQPEAALQLMA